MTDDELKKLFCAPSAKVTVNQLKASLRGRSLPVGGNKSVLMGRLREALGLGSAAMSSLEALGGAAPVVAPPPEVLPPPPKGATVAALPGSKVQWAIVDGAANKSGTRAPFGEILNSARQAH